MEPELRERLIEAMKDVFDHDDRMVNHTLEVLGHAEALLAQEPGDPTVVVAATILHDIGVPAAIARHNSPAGRFQEIEGPGVARPILEEHGLLPQDVDHVCTIIANHHSARDIDTPEFRIVWDADWLVNFPGETAGQTADKKAERIAKIFKTPAGKSRAQAMFLA